MEKINMSADNMIAIAKWKGDWYVWHGAMSNEYEVPPDGSRRFPSSHDAHAYAEGMNDGMSYCEYGIVMYDLKTPDFVPFENRVAERIIERRNKGIEKYGVGVERKDLSTEQWLTHLQEELMDAAVYIERLKYEVQSLKI
jgi:hypothetical protein